MKCKHYLALLFLFLGVCFMAIEGLSPFYYDHFVRKDGLKLAGKLGAEFEDIEGSPYYHNKSSKFDSKGPHLVTKYEPEVIPEKKGWFSSILPSKNTTAEILEKPDDLGLSVPGTRNISINHSFKYYNYTEINLLNS